MYGAIEAGGTKFICGVGTGPADLATVQIPTTSPESTLSDVIAFFRGSATPLRAIGIGSFGPVDLDRRSPTYGHITSTPKPGWRDFDLAGAVARGLNVPVGFDTDVNAAAAGEARWGAAVGLADFVYLTVGTGIGGGAVVNGSLVHGLVHPEMGHFRVPHDRSRDPFDGVCPFHRDCLEGLASGPAMQARWGLSAERLPAGHEGWALEAHYLALALVAYACTLSPRRIILGGGVMQHARLFEMVRREFSALLGGYIQAKELTDRLDEYIVPPGLGGRAGVLGALALAEAAATTADPTTTASGNPAAGGGTAQPSSADEKARHELAYWSRQKEREGTLGNAHYEFFYTTHFGLDKAFYARKRILDIGCGPRGSLEWADVTAERVGLDPLANAYLQLGANEHRMRYVAAPSEAIPFPDGHFDVVASFNSLDHVADLDRTIGEILRVLKGGGLLLLLTDVNHSPTPCEPVEFSWDVVNRFAGRFDLLEQKHFEKPPAGGLYQGVTEAVAYDHANPTKRYGILSAKFRKRFRRERRAPHGGTRRNVCHSSNI